MNDDLRQYLVVAMEDWYERLGDIETHYDEENEMIDNQGMKEDLMDEIRQTRSKLERVGDRSDM